ncbi:MAG TPA: GHMP kinase [Anaerolineae bacterium]|nr:GHMP kinase [Anaerolineae bacterium]HIQ05766.1 GHMP kinase [Anaerolineae bacterium]
MFYRAKAPLRISFCGGGTDVSPYPEERGGVVLNTTINKYAYCSLTPRQDDQIEVQSLDYDIVARFDRRERLLPDGDLALVKAAIAKMGAPTGLNLFLHSDAPPGSGLGSSSTMVVALLGLFRDWLQRPLTDYELAELAYEVERIDLGIQGGRQDQYAATFGGFNFIDFYEDVTVVNPLRIPADVLNELEYRLLLCYTGQTRLSANILRTQVQGYVERRKESVAGLDALKAIAIEMKNKLLLGRLDEFGALLHEAWRNKKRLARQISNDRIEELYDLARRHGALGGKISGAGGGGFLLVYCPFDRKHVIAEQLERAGGEVVEFGFEPHGLQTWQFG